MDSSEIKQLQILAAKARLGAILGTYHAKSGHPGGRSRQRTSSLTFMKRK